MRRVLRTTAWLVGLVALAVGVHLAGRGVLAPPPLTSPSRALDWVAQRSPAVAAFSLLRLAAEVTTWYLFALSCLVVAGRRRSSATRFGDVFVLPAAQRLVRAGLGLGVAATWSVPPATVSNLPVAAAAPVEASRDHATGSATMRPDHVADPSPLAPGTAGMRPSGHREAPTRPATSTAPPPVPSTWTVEAGESFWSIASEVVSDVLDRAATDAEVAPYWARMVDANRPRLVDPHDPDLVLPGQVLEVPPVATDVGN